MSSSKSASWSLSSLRSHTRKGQFDLSDAPSDIISSVNFAPAPHKSKLLVSSWDSKVRVYDVAAEVGLQSIITVEHRGAVLDACWGADDTEAFSAGVDHTVQR
jgi:cell cycle arrest protein BUB3